MSKISVVITVYNRVNMLRQALISILNQSMLPDELIISDDGSEENVVDAISDLVKHCPIKVKYVGQPNKGFRLAKCRNNGVRISTGDLIIFLDQDLIHTNEFIESMFRSSKEKRFVSSYPVRLTEDQTKEVNEHKIGNNEIDQLITYKQRNKIKRQFIKDYFSFLLYSFKIGYRGPKLRGGASAINRKDYFDVNGYDEKFVGWGNEDDDLRRRLYKNNIIGFNPSFDQFPIHLFHEPFHFNGERVNSDYNKIRMKEIAEGKFRCEHGVENSFEQEEIKILDLN